MAKSPKKRPTPAEVVDHLLKSLDEIAPANEPEEPDEPTYSEPVEEEDLNAAERKLLRLLTKISALWNFDITMFFGVEAVDTPRGKVPGNVIFVRSGSRDEESPARKMFEKKALKFLEDYVTKNSKALFPLDPT